MHSKSDITLLQSKASQPFPSLPSFVVSATILSFFGYTDDAAELLQVLSHVTRDYCVKHWDALRPQLFSPPMPALTKLPFIGSQDIFFKSKCEYFHWPTEEDLKQIRPTRSFPLRLKTFSIA